MKEREEKKAAEDQTQEGLSETARKYKRYYEKKFWNKTMLKNMVKKGHITEKEYELITGEEYE